MNTSSENCMITCYDCTKDINEMVSEVFSLPNDATKTYRLCGDMTTFCRDLLPKAHAFAEAFAIADMYCQYTVTVATGSSEASQKFWVDHIDIVFTRN